MLTGTDDRDACLGCGAAESECSCDRDPFEDARLEEQDEIPYDGPDDASVSIDWDGREYDFEGGGSGG